MLLRDSVLGKVRLIRRSARVTRRVWSERRNNEPAPPRVRPALTDQWACARNARARHRAGRTPIAGAVIGTSRRARLRRVREVVSERLADGCGFVLVAVPGRLLTPKQIRRAGDRGTPRLSGGQSRMIHKLGFGDAADTASVPEAGSGIRRTPAHKG